MRIFLRSVLLLSVLLLGVLTTTAQAKNLQDVSIGITPAMSTAGLLIAYEKGYFEDEGLY